MKFFVNRLFSDIINVSAGSVATYAKYGWIFTDNFIANLPSNLPVKKCENGLRFDRIVAVSLWPHLFVPGDVTLVKYGTVIVTIRTICFLLLIALLRESLM